MISPMVSDADETQTMDPVRRPARPIAVAQPPPSRVPTQPAPTVTMAPGDLEAVVARAAVQAVDLQSAKTRASDSSDDLEVTINLQRTVRRLQWGIAAVVTIGGALGTMLNAYGDQRVAAAAEDQRKVDVADALETISTQHRVDQAANVQTHKRQEEASVRRDRLQVEQGRDTRRLILEAIPQGRRGSMGRSPELEAAEDAVLGVAESGIVQ